MPSKDRKNLIGIIFAVMAGVFGGFYSLISDVSYLFPSINKLSPELIITTRIIISACISLLICLIIIISYYYRDGLARYYGFIAITKYWLPSITEKRIEYSRALFREIISNDKWPIKVSTITSEWDICRPFTEKELRILFSSNSCDVRVLLAHPESEGLRLRCEAEKGQDFVLIKNKIIHNTEYLQNIGDNKCKVRWYLNPPIFHILSNSDIMHFSPFVDGISGHDTHRYIVNSKNHLYQSFSRWFDTTWENALDPNQEMEWVKSQISANKAIFLDRDNTLIKDICYSGDIDETKIEILPEVIEGLRLLSDKKYRLIVVSNQQSVGLKIKSETELALLTKKIKNYFEGYNIYFSGFYYCKHSVAQNCNCRKPRPQLFERAIKEFNLDINRCHFIGDSDADAGVKKYIPSLKIHIINSSDSFLDIAKNICSGS